METRAPEPGHQGQCSLSGWPQGGRETHSWSRAPGRPPFSATATPRGNSQRHSCSVELLVSVRPPDGRAPSSTAKSALGLRGREPCVNEAGSQLRRLFFVEGLHHRG